MLNYTRAHELFTYDPHAGEIRRKVGRQGVKAGDLAGSPDDKGYRIVCVDYQKVKAHRLAWLMTYGSWPEGEIDHIDGDPANNRISNLRDVSASENNRNRSRCTRNKSGIVGVCWDSRVSKWIAYIKAGAIKRRIGGFCCLLDAAAARKSAELQLGFSETHGSRKTQLRT
jgi:hypothetical protein